jgi:hypothetical protein
MSEILYRTTQPVETSPADDPTNGSAALPVTQDLGNDPECRPLNLWLRNNLLCEREFIRESVDRWLAELEGAFDTKVRALELKLAEASGALNVLRTGRMLRFRDGFDSSAVYELGDVVMAGGSSFVATEDRPATAPPSDGWRLLASCGRRGQRGERGPRGYTGVGGDAGAAAPRARAWHINAKDYTATLVFDDNSVAPPLDLRPLFARFLSDIRHE